MSLDFISWAVEYYLWGGLIFSYKFSNMNNSNQRLITATKLINRYIINTE